MTPEEAERICDYILADFNRAKFGWMGLLVACALGVGGTSWFHSDNCYTIEKEYAFMRFVLENILIIYRTIKLNDKNNVQKSSKRVKKRVKL